MCQLLSALTAMHARNPPIVHRDIKPANILCFKLPDGSIQVKFIDFGLSKASNCLKTFCGSLYYAPPEIYAKINGNNFARLYTSAVDIWSLGVIFAERAVGLPYYSKSYQSNTTAWHEATLKHLGEQFGKNIELISFLLENMIHIKPHMRKSASYCQDQAFQLFNSLFQQQSFAEPEGSDLDRLLIANSVHSVHSVHSGSPQTDVEGDQSTFKLQQPLTESKKSKSHCSRIADQAHFDPSIILSSINPDADDGSDAGDGQSTLRFQQALTKSEELESHCLLITDLSHSNSSNVHSNVSPTGNESDAGDEKSSFKLQQASIESEESESHRSLIADLGCFGTFKVDTIVNITTDDDEDDEHFILKCLGGPNPDVQRSRTTNSLSVATGVEGQFWVDEFLNHDDIVPTIEAGAFQNENVFADEGHPMWILRSVGSASDNKVNRKTRALEKDDSPRISSREPKRPRIENSS